MTGKYVTGKKHTEDLVAELREQVAILQRENSELRQNEERYRLIIDNMIEGLIVHAPDLRVIYCNRSSTELFGLSFEEMLGKPIADLVWGFFREDMTALPLEEYPANQVLRTGAPHTGRVYGINRVITGDRVWVLVNAYPMYNAAGDLQQVVVTIIDITEGKRANQALRESEERLHQLADAMPQLVWTANPDGTVDYYNRRTEEYGGFTLTGENTWNWSAVLHPDDVEATVAEWNSSVETGEIYQIEHRAKMANGSYRWHLSRGIPYIGEDGKILKWFGTATDIHVQKEVEESLRSSERRLRRLVEANIIGINYRRANGQIYESNDFFLQLIGFSRDDLVEGKINWREITPPEYWGIDEAKMAEARAHGSCQPYEKEYIHRDGNRIPTLVGFASLDINNDDFVAFILDLRERKKAQNRAEEYARRLERSNKELENFAFIASHDLQEPLRKIVAFGERLNKRLEGKIDEEEMEFLKRMQDASRRMQKMIDDLLELSRVSMRSRPFAPVDLNDVARNVLVDLETRLRESNGQVLLEDLPAIEADEIQMHYLLQNLIGNAIKYCKPEAPPTVKVSASMEGSEPKAVARIFVEDNGIGFDEIYTERIFQVFERLVGRSEYEGSGMGLAICKKIVERHGGSITARSKPGVGSTFIVSLPVRQQIHFTVPESR